MKLYLSSYHLGNKANELISMYSGNTRVAVIANALDFSTDTERLQKSIDQEFADLSLLGLDPELVDLREFFDHKQNLHKVMSKFGGVWVRGGNSFVLRRAMYQSGFDDFILSKKNDNEFVYGGYSAGVCVITPTLKGIDLVDDPHVVPEGYTSEIVWDGLGLVDYSVAPHYQSNHPESELINKSVDYFIEHNIPYKTLRDGDVILVQ